MSRAVHLPDSLEALWTILADQPEATMYAGGTDVLVRMRDGLIDPPRLICLERIGELKAVEERGDRIFIGAGATHESLLQAKPIRERLPVLAQALRVLGSPPIRHMGTVGGNIVTASPAGDVLPPLYVLGAEVELRRKDGARRLPLESFILGPGRTDLRPGEILSGVWVDAPVEGLVHHFEKVGQRRALAIAVVSLAALLEVSDAGVVESARLAWGSVGPTVVRSRLVEQALIGRPLSRAVLAEAAALSVQAVSPIDDVRASAEYRRTTAGNLLLRLLQYADRPASSMAKG